MIARTILHCRHWCGALLLVWHVSSLVSGYLLYFTVFFRRGGLWLGEYANCYWVLFSQGMQKTVEESACSHHRRLSPAHSCGLSTVWTKITSWSASFCLTWLPGSKMVKDPLPNLTYDQREKLLNAWIGLSDRTFSSDLLPERSKVGELSFVRGPSIHGLSDRVGFPQNHIRRPVWAGAICRNNMFGERLGQQPR
ncbi:hypothetical protein EI94DRAFT_79346 [Lactarius quietus]|nr:hypothetical protein EI94DRAFT_79346 [Lactarius quietus]